MISKEQYAAAMDIIAQYINEGIEDSIVTIDKTEVKQNISHGWMTWRFTTHSDGKHEIRPLSATESCDYYTTEELANFSECLSCYVDSLEEDEYEYESDLCDC